MELNQNPETWKKIKKIVFEKESDKRTFGSKMKNSHHFKCPNCKHAISITNADFIRGVAMTSCDECGSNGFTVEEIIVCQ